MGYFASKRSVCVRLHSIELHTKSQVLKVLGKTNQSDVTITKSIDLNTNHVYWGGVLYNQAFMQTIKRASAEETLMTYEYGLVILTCHSEQSEESYPPF